MPERFALKHSQAPCTEVQSHCNACNKRRQCCGHSSQAGQTCYTKAIVAISILAYQRRLAQTGRVCLIMAHFNRQVLVPLAGLATMHLGEKASVSMCVRGMKGPFSPCYATGRLAHSSWQVNLLGW